MHARKQQYQPERPRSDLGDLVEYQGQCHYDLSARSTRRLVEWFYVTHVLRLLRASKAGEEVQYCSKCHSFTFTVDRVGVDRSHPDRHLVSLGLWRASNNITDADSFFLWLQDVLGFDYFLDLSHIKLPGLNRHHLTHQSDLLEEETGGAQVQSLDCEQSRYLVLRILADRQLEEERHSMWRWVRRELCDFEPAEDKVREKRQRPNSKVRSHSLTPVAVGR